MRRWTGAAIFSIGVLLLTAANAAQYSENRTKARDQATASIDGVKGAKGTKIARTKHARIAAQKLTKSALKRKNLKAANLKAARQAKAERAGLTVFDAGKPPRAKRTAIYRLGPPAKMAIRARPQHDPNYRAEGVASWYGDSFHGRRTANGETFNMDALSAAHLTLPLPSYVRVTNLTNNRSIVVRLNDRGPYRAHRLIDVSARTAKVLGFYEQGLVRVRVEYVDSGELAGLDDAALAATLRDGQLPASAQPADTNLSPSPPVPGSRLTAAALRLQAYDPDFPTDGHLRWY